jgi:hypothetical protein
MIQELAQTTNKKYISLNFITGSQVLQAATSTTDFLLVYDKLETTASKS